MHTHCHCMCGVRRACVFAFPQTSSASVFGAAHAHTLQDYCKLHIPLDRHSRTSRSSALNEPREHARAHRKKRVLTRTACSQHSTGDSSRRRVADRTQPPPPPSPSTNMLCDRRALPLFPVFFRLFLRTSASTTGTHAHEVSASCALVCGAASIFPTCVACRRVTRVRLHTGHTTTNRVAPCARRANIC